MNALFHLPTSALLPTHCCLRDITIRLELTTVTSNAGLDGALAGDNERTGRQTTFGATHCNVHRTQHCAKYVWSARLRQ